MTATLSPVEPAFCEAAGLSYLRAGAEGPAVVLLHGWSAFKEIWWSTLIALAPHARAFAPDMPGHGDSALGSSLRMALIAERAGRFCDDLGLGRITLVGHSMGGNVALELALARPDLVERLVLVDPALEGSAMPIYTRSYLGQVYGWAVMRASMTLAAQAGRLGRLIPHLHGGGMLRPALRRASYWPRHDAAALHWLLRDLIGSSVAARTAELRVPTLVISGEFDPLVPPALSERAAAAIPNARYALIRGAAHNPMDERPQAFEQALLEFLGFRPT
ncbi:MAG TPA: alpha/beta hydrolase [Roseiflexaceae bacterium]|nr:alpha/beta hydrolase [Roseiflexaceae bacterium]